MMLHATVIAIEGEGVALAGRSGAGKSDLALRLIDRGAKLVGDDYVDLEVRANRIIASPPATIAGRIEVRGVGLVDMPYLGEAPLALFVDLDSPPERLPEPSTRILMGVAVPALALAAFEASAPLKVELALKRRGSALEVVTS